MKSLFEKKEVCFGCGSCRAACKEGAITMQRDEEGFLYPVIDRSRCIGCGSCEKVCPAKHPLGTSEGRFYAVRCHDLQLLQKSTSGGMFSLLAQEVLEKGGLVCGACFDENFHVCHVLSENIDGMRKSKYVQSDMTGCYEVIAAALNAGRQVLFTGTPCQCHGMKRFFSEDCQGLILMSLICRGVQSPGLWEDYVEWLSQGGTLEAYDFRDKRQQDNGHTVAYSIDGAETVMSMEQDRFSQMYHRALTYRPSCYTCPYCCPDNDFDFTVGDFWGIEKVYPELADGRGTSLVIVRGEKGEELFAPMAEKAYVVPCDPGSALQPALAMPAKEPLLRKFLFRDYARKTEGDGNMAYIIKKYSVK